MFTGRKEWSDGDELVVNTRYYNVESGYSLKFQSDGNLVLRDSSLAAVWATDTDGLGGVKCYFQTDNNLVIRDSSGTAVWSSGTGYGVPSGVCQ